MEFFGVSDKRLELIDVPDFCVPCSQGRYGLARSAAFVLRETEAEQPQAVRWASEPETARRRAERVGERIVSAGRSLYGGIFAIS